MTSFLSTFAERHFAERPRQPLLAALTARIDGTNLIQALHSGCRPLQHLAWRRMAELPEPQLVALVEPYLKADAGQFETVAPAVLRALGHESLPLSDAILARVVSLMESPLADVRLAAAAVVALRQPDAALPLLKQGDLIDSDLLRQLCLADDPALIVPLMTAFGFPQTSPPPTIGFPVTPSWLGDHHASEPQCVEWLIRHCGYCDEDVTPEALNLLSSGFSYVTARMTNEPRMTKIAHRWLRRIRAFVWRLLPDELGLLRDDTKPFDVGDPLDTDLFLAAVRDSDRMLFLEQKSLPPFDRVRTKRDPAPVCFHASSRYVSRMFLAEPLALAERWNIPHDRRGDFVIEQARVRLEPNDEARLAADRALRGRWLSLTGAVANRWSASESGLSSPLAPLGRGAGGEGNPLPSYVGGDRACDDSPLTPNPSPQGGEGNRRTDPSQPRGATPQSTKPRAIVIGDFEPPAPDDRLSPGANSVVTLAAVCGLDGRGIANWLAEAESRWSRCLVPIGIEVQIPRVDPDHFAAWKEALPFLGVPSPNRPEFGGMVEAAFRPSKSFHAMVLGPLLLCRLGVIAEPQDMALHISLQGELGDGVRSLAFPHHFIHPSQRLWNRPDWSMARVMSKGFVHVHEDAEVIERDVRERDVKEHDECGTANATIRRTELRLFRLFAESRESVSGHQVREQTALAAFDDAVLPALRSIEADFRAGVLSDAARADAFQIVRQIIADLAEAPVETEATTVPVLCVPASHEGDELAALMLAQVLAKSGVTATVFSSKLLAAECVEQAAALAPSVVCISSLPPVSTIAARALCKRLRARLPAARIIIGLWQPDDGEFAARRERLGKAGADETYPDLRRAAVGLTEFAACTPPPAADATAPPPP